jgi:hypothetical protein
MAASEAGIAEKFVRHALIEQGLTQGPAARGPANTMIPSVWAGAPLDIFDETEIVGELAPGEFDRVVNFLREGTGTLGVTGARTRELWWTARWFGHRLEVAIVPHQGRTTIRLAQSIRGMAATTMIATVGIIGGVVAPAIAMNLRSILRIPAPLRWMALSRHDTSMIAATVGFAIAAASIPLGRRLVRWVRRRNAIRLRELAGVLTSRVRELLHKSSPSENR